MESSVDHRLSLLLDGEASEFETRRLVEDISKNPHIKRRWLEMNKQKSALRRELLMPHLDLSSKIQNELQKSKKINIQKQHGYLFSWGKIPYMRTCSYLFGLCLTLTFLFFELSSQPNQSFLQVSAPKTLVSTINPVMLDDFGRNFDGSLRSYKFISNNQVEANYGIKGSNANLKLKFFLKDGSNTVKLSSVSDGVTINTKRNNKPMIINLSSDKLSNQKLISISNLFLE
jgi:hypothetical protein